MKLTINSAVQEHPIKNQTYGTPFLFNNKIYLWTGQERAYELGTWPGKQGYENNGIHIPMDTFVTPLRFDEITVTPISGE